MHEFVRLKQVPLVVDGVETKLHVLRWDIGYDNHLPGVIIYAGRFDPPTCAHRAVVEALDLFAQLRTAEGQGSWEVVVWLHEAYGNKEVHAPPSVRSEWMQTLVRGLHTATARDVPVDDDDERPYVPQMDMYRAYRTVRLLAPGGELFTVPANVIQVIGADNVPNIRTWEEPEELWKRNWLILPRPGSVLPDELPPQSHVLGAGFYRAQEVSATDVRDKIAAGDNTWRTLVMPGVAEAIVQHRLYGYQP